MCGIVGKVAFDGRPVDPRWLSAAARALAHRGPDGQHSWIRPGEAGPSVGFGHRRLAVIDLTAAADQPMHNTGCVRAGRAASLAIVFNGEIYNYAELRRELDARGHRLETASDTEVILHLYEELGTGCVDRLRGMFAFAIWDEAGGSVFCARDRLGKKPFYYRHDGTRFWFASEGRAILTDPLVPSDVDPEALADYLQLGFVPGASSAFSALRRLPPAHWLLATRDGVEIRRYWALEYEPKADAPDDALLEEFGQRLRESVRLRLVSDVPLGAFLSGGTDSSAVVAMMAAEAPGRVRTFSIGFDDPAYDETAYAAAVARHLGTDHETFVVAPDAVRVAPRLAWHYGEPFADSSALPTYYLAELARRRITVALNGDGGDEMLMGYRRYDAFALAERARRVPGVPGLAAAVGRALPASVSRGRLYDARRFARAIGRPGPERYASWLGFFAGEDVLLEGSPLAGAARGTLERVFEQVAGVPDAERTVAADVRLYLPDDLLVKADIATMAHGLEGRSPLLDHELMAFCATLPVRLKRERGRGKILLRRFVEPLLPPGILDRPKTGFGVPLDRWFRGALGGLYRDTVLASGAMTRPWIPARAAATLIADHDNGRAHGHRLWALLMLELWARTAGDPTPPAA